MFDKTCDSRRASRPKTAPTMKSILIMAALAAAVALGLGSCTYPGGYGSGYSPGSGYTSGYGYGAGYGYGYPYYSAYPYYGGANPYYGGGFVIGGIRHGQHFGGQHFSGRTFGRGGGFGRRRGR